jgi:pseudaminic acid cytidylyltransferase
LAIIPARGGSKRIPRKNIREFCGKPIIAYSIETALQSGLFDDVMVSTDDAEIAQIARQYGATIPFMRSPETANDHAGIFEVLREVLDRYARKERRFTQVCCLLPTAPLLLESDLREALELLKREDFDSVFPVTTFSYPILRALTRDGDRTRMIWPENYAARSQDLQPAFHDCGLFYWINALRILPKGRMFTDNSGTIVLPETRVQDVDTEEDWKICELKYRLNRE